MKAAIAAVLAALAMAAAPARGSAQVAPATETPAPLPSETLGVATLRPAHPHRLFVGKAAGGVAIVDGDTARLEGSLYGSPSAQFGFSPDNRFFYVVDIVRARGNRGARLDLLTIYDATTLKPVGEITLPGRLLASPRRAYFDVSADGARAFVYNLDPASSVVVVDLIKRRVVSSVETPGCGLVLPFGSQGFASLCSDGVLSGTAVDARGKGSTGRTKPFFDAEADPIFEENALNRETGRGVLLSFNGMLFPAVLGSQPQVGEGWSLQGAAGLAPATNAPQQRTWRPGGRVAVALHRPTGLLYILMHQGKPWSAKAPGTEVWVVDPRQKLILRRLPLPTSGYVVAVSQDAAPQLYVISESGDLWVMDPATGAILRHMGGLARPPLVAVVGS